MKTTISNPFFGRMMTAMTFFAASSFALATPEMAPSGDKEISEFVAMDVASDSRMEGTEVSVKIKDGIAILTGKVKTLDQAERAAERALATDGVRGVANLLEIAAGSHSDSMLHEAAVKALAASKALDAGRIKVSAESGTVMLSGEVSTWDEQEIAREVVSKVPGVREIENRTEVVFGSVRTDEQIRAQLEGLIANDPLYDGLSLSVAVKEGVVKLKGEVGSRGEYDRLVRRSSVTGVFEVSADGLKVNPDLAMEAVGDKNPTPEQMMAALEDVLKADGRVDTRAISFGLSEGVVTIKGSAPDKEERIAAESAARGIPGVLAVDNRVRVSASERPLVSANAPTVTPR